MTPLDCKVLLPQESQSEKGAELTVGEVFQLRCLGERPVFAEIEMKLALPEDKEFALRILGSTFSSDSEMVLDVVSYVPGEHQLEEFYLISGTDHVPINPIKFQVRSVIDPANPPKEPYPAKGPLLLGTPIWYFLAIALPILFIASAVAIRSFFYFRRKQLVDNLKADRPVAGSYQTFNKELRQLQRKYRFLASGEAQPQDAENFVSELDRSFSHFLEWHFLIPYRGRGQRTYLKELKRRLSKNEEACYEPIRRALVELARARNERILSALDCRQLLDVTRLAANSASRAYRLRESA